MLKAVLRLAFLTVTAAVLASKTVAAPVSALLAPACPAVTGAPLMLWNAGPTRENILRFVSRVTTPASPDFVAPADRIAVFDNDGTLWTETPFYTQGMFALDRVRALASAHPEWQTTEPFRTVLKGSPDDLKSLDEKAAGELVMATHAGMSTDAFAETVQQWLRSARHPVYQRRYTDLAFEPMVELLCYLRERGFRRYIVSGGGIEFLRTFSQTVYGIPPEQVIGSSVDTRLLDQDGKLSLVREPKIAFVNDGPGKPVGINRFIGARPIMAFGNSDGDFEMMRWVTEGAGPRFAAIVHHTDAVREARYDRTSPVGKLDRALDEAPRRGWTLIDMARDWKRVFRPAQP